MTRASALPAIGPGEHAVQFYQADGELAATAGEWLAEGFASGAGIVVVAAPAHWRDFEARLKRSGADVARARLAGRLQVADAAEVLGSFLAGDFAAGDAGELDPGRFREALSGLIRRAGSGGRPVRVFGEMVGLLWEAGQVNLAIELEGLWNGLGALLPFALLCGYPADVTAAGGDAAALRELCGLHSDVIATRAYPGELDSVRAARHFAGRLLTEAPAGELAQDVALVVTELTANAVLHARSGFTLTLRRSAGLIGIEVRDSVPLAPRGDGPPFDAQAGHGLGVVAQLASDWSVEGLADGKAVWAELAVKRG